MLYLGEYEVFISYHKGFEESTIAGGEASMRILVDRIYLTLKIEVSKYVYDLYKEKNYRYIAQIVLHELSHALTDPYYMFLYENVKIKDTLSEINERQTERISSAIMSFVTERDYLPEYIAPHIVRKTK